MAQNTDININAKTWTQLTDADVSAITFQNKSGHAAFVKATTDATPPTSTAGAIRYNPGQGERNATVSDLFPGISGADRIYVYSDEPVTFFVSHA